MTAASTSPQGSGIGALFDVVLDCSDPWSLADFWSQLIGSPVDKEDSTDAWVQLTHVGTGPRMSFQRVKRYVAPTWPDGAPQQVHFDVAVTSVPDAELQVLALGATALSDMKGSRSSPWRVYADPAGHPFCLVTCPKGWPLQ